MPQKNRKNCGIVVEIGFEPILSGLGTNQCAIVPPCIQACLQTWITLVFLVFLPDILVPGVFSFLGFYHAIPGCGICFNRSVPKKSSPAASNLSMFLRA